MTLIRAHLPHLIARLSGLESREYLGLKSGLRRSITSSPALLFPKMATTGIAGPAAAEAAPPAPQMTSNYKPRYIDVSYAVPIGLAQKAAREAALGTKIGR